jgi:hypothetical protein
MEPNEKPDLSIVQAALEATGEAQRKFDVAASNVRDAQAVRDAAQQDYDAIVARAASGEAVDGMAAASALLDANMKLEFAGSVAANLQDRLEAAKATQIGAQAESYRRVLIAGKDARIAAAGRIDAALVEFRSALGEYHRASGLIGSARANGLRPAGSEHLPHSGHLAEIVHRMAALGSTAQAESEFWRGVGV